MRWSFVAKKKIQFYVSLFIFSTSSLEREDFLFQSFSLDLRLFLRLFPLGFEKSRKAKLAN